MGMFGIFETLTENMPKNDNRISWSQYHERVGKCSSLDAYYEYEGIVQYSTPIKLYDIVYMWALSTSDIITHMDEDVDHIHSNSLMSICMSHYIGSDEVMNI